MQPKTFSISLYILLISVMAAICQQNDGLDGLRATIPGEPGRDYPIYSIADLQRFSGGQVRSGPRQQQQQQQQIPRQQRQRASNGNFQQQISNGQIPGVPGRDYPINSISGLRNRFNGIQPAPANFITPDYPGIGQNSGNTRQSFGNPRPIAPSRNTNNNINTSGDDGDETPMLFNGNYCPGGSLEQCIFFCPQEIYAECVTRCGQAC